MLLTPQPGAGSPRVPLPYTQGGIGAHAPPWDLGEHPGPSGSAARGQKGSLCAWGTGVWGWPREGGGGPRFWVGFGVPGFAASASLSAVGPSACTPLGLVTVETKLAQGGNAIPELIKVITASHQLLTRSKDLL